MQELSPVQALAVAQYIYKSAAGIVSTKAPTSLRSMVDGDVVANYESTGAKSYDIRMPDGSKVGTVSVRVGKEKQKEVIRVTNQSAYVFWCGENNLGHYVPDEKLVLEHVHETGELPEGAEIVTETEPEHVSGTTLKIDEGKVAASLGTELPATVAGLLGGGR